VPAGGALVPELLARANRAAGNEWGAAAIEHSGPIVVQAGGVLAEHGLPSRQRSGIEVSVDGACVRLAPGEKLEISAPRARVGYLAVRGGFDVPPVLGGRGTLLVAGFGGHEGRPLRAGDELPVGGAAGARDRVPPLAIGETLRVIPGPDEPGAWTALLSATFRISARSDRVGTRLEGEKLPREGADSGLSLPAVRGAIQLPSSGLPVILGPDHPTTGGYPVIAVVIRADHGVLGAMRPGDPVRFAAVSLEEARAAWAQRPYR
jgi:biotin-dependent carboxylase-like uncharacterized protein